MTRLPLVVCWPLVLLTTGCLDDQRARLLPTANQPPAPRPTRAAPGTETTAKRVLSVGQQLIAANPQIGLRPAFVTLGVPHAEIFHRGGPVDSWQVFVSEGLVKRCADDEQLAALLALELGKISAEREALARVPGREKDQRLPPNETIGNDVGGTFGAADGTRRMELAELEQQRKKREPAATPEALARKYMTKAGFEAKAVDAVAPLVQLAESHLEVERGFTSTPPR